VPVTDVWFLVAVWNWILLDMLNCWIQVKNVIFLVLTARQITHVADCCADVLSVFKTYWTYALKTALFTALYVKLYLAMC
jgi:hypothetical protein